MSELRIRKNSNADMVIKLNDDGTIELADGTIIDPSAEEEEEEEEEEIEDEEETEEEVEVMRTKKGAEVRLLQLEKAITRNILFGEEVIAKVEEKHELRYRKLLEKVKNGTVFKRDTPIKWKCRNCGYIHEGTEPPELCPACNHTRAYFEELAENY